MKSTQFRLMKWVLMYGFAVVLAAAGLWDLTEWLIRRRRMSRAIRRLLEWEP